MNDFRRRMCDQSVVRCKRALAVGMDDVEESNPRLLSSPEHRPGRSYLAEWRLGKGYAVIGCSRTRTFGRSRIEHLRRDEPYHAKSLFLHYGVYRGTRCGGSFRKCGPRKSTIAGSATRFEFEILVDCVKSGWPPPAARDGADPDRAMKVYPPRAPRFGSAAESPQTETQPPGRRPFWLRQGFATRWPASTAIVRFLCCNASFTTTNPRGGRENFVTAQTRGPCRGSPEARRKNGHRQPRKPARWARAQDYVVAMWLMLQHDKPRIYRRYCETHRSANCRSPCPSPKLPGKNT